MLNTQAKTITNNAIAFAIIITIVTGVSQNLYAATDVKSRITATSDVKPMATLTSAELRGVALAAGRLLNHVDAARQAIAADNKDVAIQQVDLGLKLVQIIENAIPKHKITTDIKSGDIDYHNEEDVAQRYVAIYDEQHVEDIITPVLHAKKLQMGSQRLKGKEEIKHYAEHPNLTYVSAQEDISMYKHTSAKLDVLLARRMLEAAKKNLNEGNNDYANNDLLLFQSNGITFSIESDELPLVEAAENLKLAQAQARDGLHTEALLTLKLASIDLQKYELHAGESKAREVRELHHSIDRLTQSLEGESDLKIAIVKAEKEIESWWNTTIKWMEK